MAIGRWKQNRAKRGRFIRRALSRTEATQKAIAKRAGTSTDIVGAIQSKERIRPPELSKAIGAKSSGQTRAAMFREGLTKRRLKKISHFTNAEKNALLENEKNKKNIISITGGWWKSEIIKWEYGNRFEDFLNDIKKSVSDYLDYFDPEKEGEDGKPANVSTWMAGSAKIHCRKIYFNIKKREEKQRKIRESGDSGAIHARSWVPVSTKSLLKKLGLDPIKVAEVGFDDIRKQILAISEEKQTGLTERQKLVIRLRLEGKTMPEIAERFRLRARSSIHSIDESAARKIKSRIAQIAGSS